MRFACVHGINVEPRDTIAPTWQHLLHGCGLSDAECVDVRWTSTGWFSLDAASFTLASVLEDAGQRPQFKRRAIAEVTNGLKRALRDDPSTIVLAHSMGTPLVTEALRALMLRGIAPRVVFFGTPFGHPVWSLWLRAQYVRAPARGPNIYSSDDPIVTFDAIEPVFPKWMRNVRIAVADNAVPPWMWEHDASLYFPHPVTIRELEALR